ncbi:MAG TPA: ORF6N domain-containing protein [Chitinophagaceae bacterium]|nr:ORF6N domain-containing protein [Chitinophagaceae bacterium]
MENQKIEQVAIADEVVISKIYLIRGQKVMIDRDLAELYGVEPKRLKEAVRRNASRFPEDFMFEMSKEELENWRTQFAASNSDKMGLRYAPYAFTEQVNRRRIGFRKEGEEPQHTPTDK